MPATLTPQNTQKDISLNGHGKLMISNPQPQNSGMLTCTVIIAKNDDNTNSGKKTSFQHHIIVIEKPKHIYSLTYDLKYPRCKQKLEKFKKGYIATIDKQLCGSKRCVGKAGKMECVSRHMLRYTIRGPSRLAKQWTERDEKEMQRLFRVSATTHIIVDVRVFSLRTLTPSCLVPRARHICWPISHAKPTSH